MVVVHEDADGTRWLDFDDGAVQSRMLRAHPARLVLEYTRLMMGVLLLRPAPARMAMIGLGGGSLAKYCVATLPDVDFTAVEIDPDVIALRDTFGIPPDGPRFRIVREDGAAFVRRDGPPLDILIVDAFVRGGQPDALGTAAFYDYCRERLAPGGVLAVNLYIDDPAYELRLGRIRDTFDGRLVVVDVPVTENDLIFAGNEAAFPPPFPELVERLRALAPSHPVGLEQALNKIAQYSPARHAARRQRREASQAANGARFD
jgi:spermidine synthase